MTSQEAQLNAAELNPRTIKSDIALPAIKALIEMEWHLLALINDPLRQRGNGKLDKSPVPNAHPNGFNSPHRDSTALWRGLEAGNLLGIVPASANMICYDCDEPGAVDYVTAKLSALKLPFVTAPSISNARGYKKESDGRVHGAVEHKHHVWTLGNDALYQAVGNGKWYMRQADGTVVEGGDMRGKSGYVACVPTTDLINDLINLDDGSAPLKPDDWRRHFGKATANRPPTIKASQNGKQSHYGKEDDRVDADEVLMLLPFILSLPYPDSHSDRAGLYHALNECSGGDSRVRDKVADYHAKRKDGSANGRKAYDEAFADSVLVWDKHIGSPPRANGIGWGTLYKLAYDGGYKPAKRKTAGSVDGKRKDDIVSAPDEVGLQQALDKLGIEVAWDARAHKLTAREGGSWSRLDKHRLNHLKTRIEGGFFYLKGDGEGQRLAKLRYSRDSFAQYIDYIRFESPTRDPFIEWLEALPLWESVPEWYEQGDDLGLVFNHLWKTPVTKLSMHASAAIPLACIQRAYEPGSKIDESIVLYGPKGGEGKSDFGAKLVPPGENLFVPEMRWKADTKKLVEAAYRAVLVEMAEIQALPYRQVPDLKAFLTTTSDNDIRLPYRPDTLDLPRRFTVYCTTNEEQPIPADPSRATSRRFVIVECLEGSDVKAFMQQHRDRLWALALHKYRHGMRANLPRELYAERDKVNAQHTFVSGLEEALIKYASHFQGGMSASEILQFLKSKDGDGKTAPRYVGPAGARAVSDTCKKLGWDSYKGTSGKHHNVKVWMPK